MPYKSEAQRRYFHYAAKLGKIKASVVKEFDSASKGKKLPEHVALYNSLKKFRKKK